ncbi:MAG: hypothetical protein FJ014_11520 [Chloroflexi bacterium]|nr:hypothetical protein [Chloroflexota bacterium]
MNLKRFVYLGLLIVALMVAACRPKATPAPTATPKPTDTPEPTATTGVLIPAITTVGEVPMGFTEEGSPYRGSPDAPVTLVEHSEFQ